MAEFLSRDLWPKKIIFLWKIFFKARERVNKWLNSHTSGSWKRKSLVTAGKICSEILVHSERSWTVPYVFEGFIFFIVVLILPSKIIGTVRPFGHMTSPSPGNRLSEIIGHILYNLYIFMWWPMSALGTDSLPLASQVISGTQSWISIWNYILNANKALPMITLKPWEALFG